MALQSPSLLRSDIPTLPGRIAWLDNAKSIGIFFVVLGHTLRGLLSSQILEPSPLLEGIDQWIYAFHMPLFFFISGLFAERLAVKPWRQVWFNRVQVIIYPYILWSVLQEILRTITGTRAEPIADLWRISYEPVMQFWFLYVLAIASLAYTLLRKCRVPIYGFFILGLLLYLAHWLGVNFGGWGVLYMVRINLLYFGLGALVTQTNWLSRLEELSPTQLVCGAAGGFGIIALAVGLGIAERLELVPILAAIGIFASCSLARWMDGLGDNGLNRNLREWGILSLQIFVAHTIFSAIARVILQKLHAPPAIHILLGTAAGLYGSIFLYRICEKINFPYAFSLRPAKG
jgi:fucose 4-O-acetylase-like acetyltransferase